MFRTMFMNNRLRKPQLSRQSSISLDGEDIENLAQEPTFCGAKEELAETECLKFVCISREVAEHGIRQCQLSGNQQQHNIHLLLVKLFGEVHALQAECPNCGARLIQGCLSQGRILCPRHGSAFDVRTGLLEWGFGFHSLWVYECRTLGGNVFVKCPLERFRRRCELPVMRVCPRHYKYLDIANRPIVIVGAGIAALSCALTLREKGYSGRLVLLCREPIAPYDRQALSKQLYPPEEQSSCFSMFPDCSIYDQLSIELMVGVNVREVLPQERTITLEGQSRHKQLEYAFLVLAVGAMPRKLAIHSSLQQEVLHLRSLEDAKRLASETTGKSVAIIGSGLLGVELASILRQHAKSVSLFGKFASSLAIFGENVRTEILDWLHHNGINVMRNSATYDFQKCGNRVQICFKEITTGVGLCAIADKLVAAIGIMPCTSNLMRANIRMDPKGFVLVDEQMRTNQPGVLACGDCVSMHLDGGQRMNWPHWQMAQQQGKVAAHTILGIPPEGGNGQQGKRKLVPFFWLDLPERRLTFAGWPRPSPEERIQFGSIQDNNYLAYHLRNGHVVAVASCGPINLAIQFCEIFAKDLKISKERVLRNHDHNWTHYSASS